MSKKCVFLDRDGTLIVDHGYTYRVEDLIFLPDVLDGLLMLKELGFLLIIITNQSGVARGYYTLNDVDKFHNEINARLYLQKRITIDAFYICPHYEFGVVDPFNIKCKCRKPSPELLIKASQEHQIDLKKSFMIGNEYCDIIAGRKAGLQEVLVVDDKHSFIDAVFAIKKKMN